MFSVLIKREAQVLLF